MSGIYKIVLFLFISLIGQSQTTTRIIIPDDTTFIDGKVFKLTYLDSKKNSEKKNKWVRWENFFTDGVMDSTYLYFRNGNIRVKRYYENKRNKSGFVYRKNGQKIKEEYYRFTPMEISREWYPNGKLKHETIIKNNLSVGYFRNGKIKSEIENDTFKEYHKNGMFSSIRIDSLEYHITRAFNRYGRLMSNEYVGEGNYILANYYKNHQIKREEIMRHWTDKKRVVTRYKQDGTIKKVKTWKRNGYIEVAKKKRVRKYKNPY